jgi:taurine dioxygenase
MKNIRIKPLSGTIGAEFHGIDISQPLTATQIEQVRQALLEYKVLFFPEQPPISTERHVAFARAFGALETDFPSFAAQTEEMPEITVFDGAVSSGRASIWHTDLSVSQTPTMGGIIYMKEVPSRGGDTMWADLEAAYEALSPAMREFLEARTAVHDMFSREYGSRPGAFDVRGRKDIDFSRVSRAEHPVVRVHPETGRKCLFVNPFFTSHIVGLSSEESATILNFLYAHMQKPEFIVRRHWSRGDVGFWDNRCTMHTAVDDYGEGARLVHRVCIRGDIPSGVEGRHRESSRREAVPV